MKSSPANFILDGCKSFHDYFKVFEFSVFTVRGPTSWDNRSIEINGCGHLAYQLELQLSHAGLDGVAEMEALLAVAPESSSLPVQTLSGSGG